MRGLLPMFFYGEFLWSQETLWKAMTSVGIRNRRHQCGRCCALTCTAVIFEQLVAGKSHCWCGVDVSSRSTDGDVEQVVEILSAATATTSAG